MLVRAILEQDILAISDVLRRSADRAGDCDVGRHIFEQSANRQGRVRHALFRDERKIPELRLGL